MLIVCPDRKSELPEVLDTLEFVVLESFLK